MKSLKLRYRTNLTHLLPILLGISLLSEVSLFRVVIAADEPLTIYTYDSFLGKHTLGELAQKEFEVQKKIKVRFVPFGSAGEALNQVVLEGGKTAADIVLGIDGGLKPKGHQSKLFRNWEKKPGLLSEGLEDWDENKQFVPFDHGYLAFVYDSARTKIDAASMKWIDFVSKPEWRKRVAIEDPRTSSLGLGLLLATHVLFPGESLEKFWKKFGPQILTVSPGWSGAYGLFLKKEVDFVFSYTTSVAYHREEEKTDVFRALLFEEGNIHQVEAAGLVKTSKKAKQAQAFLDWLLSADIQTRLPKLQWMFPARKGVALPSSFETLPKVKKVLEPPSDWDESKKSGWLRDWEQWLAVSQ